MNGHVNYAYSHTHIHTHTDPTDHGQTNHTHRVPPRVVVPNHVAGLPVTAAAQASRGNAHTIEMRGVCVYWAAYAYMHTYTLLMYNHGCIIRISKDC
jgi:hypothetical protein